MSWIEIRAEFPPTHDLSPYIEIYRAFGIENTLEVGSTLSGCMTSVDGTAERVEELSRALHQAGALEVRSSELPEENWEIAWRQFFKPRRVGRHFVVRPSWETFETGPSDIELVLDPGQAFGTGDHPTTRQCLELMEDAAIDGSDVADIGCGSGILSVAACKLGACSVVAVDIEPIAVEVALENAARNDVQFTALVGEGLEPAIERSSGGFDVVLSNIISAILIRIARDVALALRPGGRWVISGVIAQNWEDVLEAALRTGFHLKERREEDGWVAALFVRP